MLGTWLVLLLLAAAIWSWMDALTSRERAIHFGRELCEQAGVQLLDQSVSLKRLRIKRIDGLPAFLRRYDFDVSVDGSDRHRGHLDLAAGRLQAWSLPLAEARAAAVDKPRHLRLVQ